RKTERRQVSGDILQWSLKLSRRRTWRKRRRGFDYCLRHPSRTALDDQDGILCAWFAGRSTSSDRDSRAKVPCARYRSFFCGASRISFGLWRDVSVVFLDLAWIFRAASVCGNPENACIFAEELAVLSVAAVVTTAEV